ADLGLAKHFRHDSPGASHSVSLTQLGERRGTASYMAREQIADSKSAGPPADVFALGAILYECLAGVPAFGGDSLVEIMIRVEEGAFAPLPSLAPATPAWLVTVIERALAREPSQRFADGAALAAALAAGGARIRGRKV